jgi:hypothetical protein
MRSTSARYDEVAKVRAGEIELPEHKAQYESAVRECSASMKLIPLPVGAIVGAMAKKIHNVTKGVTLEEDPDGVLDEGAYRYFANSEVSFYHPYKLDIPISLTEVDLAYMPPWLLPVEEMKNFNESFKADEFIDIVSSRFSVLLEAFRPPIGVSKVGGASLGSYQTRLFVETRVLNQNNEFPDQPIDPVKRRSFALDTYEKLVRSMGTWGYLIKPPDERNPMSSQTLTNTMVRQLAMGRPLGQDEFMSKLFSQSITKLRNESTVIKSFSDWNITKYQEFISDERNPHVWLMYVLS